MSFLAVSLAMLGTAAGAVAVFLAEARLSGERARAALVNPLARDALPWMWGVNGATSVLASILAVAISMWAGISVNLLIAAVLYLLLVLPARALARAAVPTLQTTQAE